MARWCIKDCCGIVCATFAYLIILGSDYVISYGTLWKWMGLEGLPYILLYNVIVGIAIWAHIMCMCTDPGAVPLDETELSVVHVEEGIAPRRCKKCQIPKPPRAHHCSVCKRCILKMDHHCPWVNNCVGQYNQKHFMLFLLYIFFMSMNAIVVLSSRVMSCRHRQIVLFEHRRAQVADGCHVANIFVFLGILVFFMAIVFGLFTLVMLCDQTSGLMANQTGIEALQNTKFQKRPLGVSLQDMMGCRFGWQWFLPVEVKKAAPKAQV